MRRPRLPDFLIIGAMKSGTSSLYRWLAAQPELALPETKEIHFFSRDQVWDRGLDWYAGLFAGAPGQLVGEASTTYTNPDHSEAAAVRMAATVPDARLVYLLRHPVDRLRSHYRHAVLQGEESRPLDEVMEDPGNRFLRRSLYFTCVEPYLARFPPGSLLVVRFEDLVGEGSPAWTSVLGHLGLPARPAPSTAHNVSSARGSYTPLMRALARTGLRDAGRRLPGPLRRVARPALTRHRPPDGLLDGSAAPVDDDRLAPLWADVARLEAHLGCDRPLWDRVAAPPGLR